MCNLFGIGQLTATKGVHTKMGEDKKFDTFVKTCLGRYIRGDWGDTCEEDKKSNDYAVKNEERILAAYNYSEDCKIWIITEWDRSYTTILFPEEY